MDNEKYADFIQYYREQSEDGNSFKALWQLNSEYKAVDAHLASQSGMQIQEPALKMDSVSNTKTFDVTPHQDALRKEYKTKADNIAREHGFTGLSYDEHVKLQEAQKQGDKGKQTEIKSPISDRESKRQEFLKQIKSSSERNRLPDRDRDR